MHESPRAIARPAHINAAFSAADRARIGAAAAAAGVTPTGWLHRVALLHLDDPQGAPTAPPPPLPAAYAEPPGNLRRVG